MTPRSQWTAARCTPPPTSPASGCSDTSARCCVGSGLAADVDAGAVPVIDGVRALLADGMVAGGTQRNHAFVDESVEWNGPPLDEQLLLADAQTSGGLLLAVAPDAVDQARRGARPARGTLAAAVVGHTRTGTAGRNTIRPNDQAE